jgi:hypothetical protein
LKIASFLSHETDRGSSQWRSKLGHVHFQITTDGSTPATRPRINSTKWPLLAASLIALILVVSFLAKRLSYR